MLYVKKGTLLQRAGEHHHEVYVVQQGLLRSYALDAKGREHIYMFAPEGWIIADNAPPGEVSELYIDALEDSTLLVRTKRLDSDVVDPLPLVRRIAVLQRRIIMLMSAPAIERYQHFCETYPQIVQRVPQRMIASYLGITPEALSKVKRQDAQRQAEEKS